MQLPIGLLRDGLRLRVDPDPLVLVPDPLLLAFEFRQQLAVVLRFRAHEDMNTSFRASSEANLSLRNCFCKFSEAVLLLGRQERGELRWQRSTGIPSTP